jgi:hypothetical protein
MTTAVTPPEVTPPDVKPERWPVPGLVGPALRVAGFVTALVLAALTATFEAFLTPLYWHQTRMPLALVAAVVGNVGLVWFTAYVTGRRVAAAGPALVWVVIMVAASSRTSEGDLVLIDGNWVGIATMLAGSVAFALAGYRLILASTRPAAAPAATPAAAPAATPAAAPQPRSDPDPPA